MIDLKALPRFLELPVLSLQTAVVFPHASRSIVLNRPALLRAIDAVQDGGIIAVAAQKNPEQDEPRIADLHPIGTLAIVRRPASIPELGAAIPIALDGIGRIRLDRELQHAPYLRAKVERIESIAPADDDVSFNILRTRLVELVAELVTHSLTLPDDLVAFSRQLGDAGALADVVAAGIVEVATERHELLAELDVRRRIEKLIEVVRRERIAQKLRDELHTEVEERIGERQRELLLREQMNAIRKELGEGDEGFAGIGALRDNLRTAGLPPEALAEAERELERLGHMSLGSPEYSLSRTYVETLASLPWTKLSGRAIDLKRAGAILDEDHFDLAKVKERVLEFLAVQKLNPALKAPVLCLVGPPGVGKTSLGASIARATGREFVRVSLGGVHDEAEIRGHRRTYVGAMPGQILRGLQRAGARDPLFLLDEIDKLGRDHHGDPYAAMLEVLDPDQNGKFHDNYIDLPFDLSRVLFVCTANILDPLPPALRDRMEILELSGYVKDEKLQIAMRHLVPRVGAEHGLSMPRDLQFSADAIREIIASYTHEAGVRKLEQHIAAICRKRARQLAESKRGRRLITPTGVRKHLGVPMYRAETQLAERTREPGVAIGLAWTPAGGDTLFVEARRIPRGRGKITFTGQLGDVMEESAKAAVTWVRASADFYGIDAGLFSVEDLHIHFPSGGIPKDGPSAGVVLAAALISLYTERPVSSHVAMTGEITLSGHLLPVSGLKEKLLAARRSGITDVVLPASNEPDVREDVPPHIHERLTLHYVKTIEAAIRIAIPSTTLVTHAASRRHAASGRHAYAARSQR